MNNRTENSFFDDDGRFVRTVLGGKVDAFDILVERYQRQVTARAYRILDNMDDAMEVDQEAFVKAFEDLAQLARAESFGAWLMRIATNVALNRRRSRALRRTATLGTCDDSEDVAGEAHFVSNAPAPADIASAGDLSELIATELEKLPPMQRKALMLFSVEKMPQKEVASILGCSVEAVKWNVFMARRRLKEKLKDYL